MHDNRFVQVVGNARPVAGIKFRGVLVHRAGHKPMASAKPSNLQQAKVQQSQHRVRNDRLMISRFREKAARTARLFRENDDRG